MNDLVTLSVTQGVALVQLNRPEAFNALSFPMVQQLSKALLEVASNTEIRAVVLAGSGKAFSAGGDLKRALAHPQGPPAAFRELATHVHVTIVEIRRMAKPVIGAINGVAAAGGFSLALACDFRVMGANASFRQAFTSQGLCMGGGVTFTLPRLIGLSRALEVAAFDEPISADRAAEWHLVNKVVADEAVIDEALSMARVLSRKSVHAFAWSKRLLTDSLGTRLEAHLENERSAFLSCVSHPDGEEGMRAFVQKRSPVY